MNTISQQTHKPRWRFEGVSRKIANTLDIEEMVNKSSDMPNENKLKMLVNDLIENVGKSSVKTDNTKIMDFLNILRKKYRITPSKSEMRYIYEKYFIDTKVNIPFSRFIIKKAMRSRSGVLVVTIVLKPDKFSCPKKCSYCPTETDLKGNPTQPKSYLSTEPAMLRALQYDFDVKGQLHDRIRAYIKTGNISDNQTTENHSYKLEVIVSGGT